MDSPLTYHVNECDMCVGKNTSYYGVTQRHITIMYDIISRYADTDECTLLCCVAVSMRILHVVCV